MWIIPAKHDNDPKWHTLKATSNFALQKYSPSKTILDFFIGSINSIMMSIPFEYRIVIHFKEVNDEQQRIFVIALANSKKDIMKEWNELEKKICPELVNIQSEREKIQFALNKIENIVTSLYSIYYLC